MILLILKPPSVLPICDCNIHLFLKLGNSKLQEDILNFPKISPVKRLALKFHLLIRKLS